MRLIIPFLWCVIHSIAVVPVVEPIIRKNYSRKPWHWINFENHPAVITLFITRRLSISPFAFSIFFTAKRDFIRFKPRPTLNQKPLYGRRNMYDYNEDHKGNTFRGKFWFIPFETCLYILEMNQILCKWIVFRLWFLIKCCCIKYSCVVMFKLIWIKIVCYESIWIS